MNFIWHMISNTQYTYPFTFLNWILVCEPSWLLFLQHEGSMMVPTCASKVRPEWQRLSGLQRMKPGRISSSSIPFSLNLRFSPGLASSVSTSSLSRLKTSTVCCKTDLLLHNHKATCRNEVLLFYYMLLQTIDALQTKWRSSFLQGGILLRKSHPVWHHDQLLGFTDGSRLQLPENHCAHVLAGEKQSNSLFVSVIEDEAQKGLMNLHCL